MTLNIDILGRPPIMKPLEREEMDLTPEDDWRGKRFIKVVRSTDNGFNGFNVNVAPVKNKQAVAIERRNKLAGLIAKGMTETDMAAATGVTRTTITYDLKAMGLRT
tara:strand:- start:2966 stop:3283 length:318 start_codon:yes stop_codon:yes gene_type:complete